MNNNSFTKIFIFIWLFSFLFILITLINLGAFKEDIDRNGYTGIGKPEPLKYDLSGYWSRRIDAGNRIVYKIEDGIIKIVQCGSHYTDK